MTTNTIIQILEPNVYDTLATIFAKEAFDIFILHPITQQNWQSGMQAGFCKGWLLIVCRTIVFNAK